MPIGKPTLAVAATLALLTAYAVNGAFTRGDAAGEQGGKSRFSQLFSTADGDLERRIHRLESSLDKAQRIQSELLELVEELHRRLDRYAPAGGEERTATVGIATARAEQRREPLPRHERYRRHREAQLQRLIDAGLNPDRAQFILDKQERFQYDHMRLSYEYRHLKNKSSDEAKALRAQLNIYSHPNKVFAHELSEQEFDIYQEVIGGRQEMRINRVVRDTPAANAGLRPGDKIISYNGERIFHMGDLRTQVYRVAPGKTVAVEVQRAGSSGTELIYLPSGPLGIQG